MSEPFRTPILTGSLGPWGLVGDKVGGPSVGAGAGVEEV